MAVGSRSQQRLRRRHRSPLRSDRVQRGRAAQAQSRPGRSVANSAVVRRSKSKTAAAFYGSRIPRPSIHQGLLQSMGRRIASSHPSGRPRRHRRKSPHLAIGRRRDGILRFRAAGRDRPHGENLSGRRQAQGLGIRVRRCLHHAEELLGGPGLSIGVRARNGPSPRTCVDGAPAVCDEIRTKRHSSM